MLRRCLVQNFTNPFFYWLAEPVHDYLPRKRELQSPHYLLGNALFFDKHQRYVPSRLPGAKMQQVFQRNDDAATHNKSPLQGKARAGCMTYILGSDCQTRHGKQKAQPCGLG